MYRQQQALLTILMGLFYASPAWGTTIYVGSSADSGPGTLREAAAYSNTATGVQTIEIIVSDQIDIINTINIQSPVIIQGNHNTVSSNGYTVLDLMAGSDGSVIRNMVITDAYRSGHAGIKIETDHNTITGCVIGTNWLGQFEESNYHGIYLYYADDNYIGGTRTEGNVISGNSNYGVYLDNSHRNIIAGNTIGLTPDKNSPRSNYSGIYLYYSDYNNIGLLQDNYHNIVSGNNGYGLHIGNGSNGNSVQNNFIGINEDSSTYSGQDYGLYITGDNNLIGSDSTNGRNVISGNMTYEIYISSDSNTITRNYIGANVAGTQIIPGYAGTKIYLYYAEHNIIGFKGSGNGNVILGGAYGIKNYYNSYYNGWYGNIIQGFSTEGIYSRYNNCQPSITYAHTDRIWGNSQPNYYIEVFKAPDAKGGSELFLGYTYADDQGNWALPVTGISEGDYVTTLATGNDYDGNTSEFSTPFIVDNSSATPVPLVPTPTLTPTPTPDYGVQVGKIKAFNNILRRNSSYSLPCTLRWQQPHDAATTIRILNANGNLVIKLASNQWYSKDQVHILTWDSRDSSGNPVASGLYYAHIQSNDVNHFAKILVMDR